MDKRGACPRARWQLCQRRLEAEHMEAPVAFVANLPQMNDTAMKIQGMPGNKVKKNTQMEEDKEEEEKKEAEKKKKKKGKYERK